MYRDYVTVKIQLRQTYNNRRNRSGGEREGYRMQEERPVRVLQRHCDEVSGKAFFVCVEI